MNTHRETIKDYIEKKASIKSRVGEGFNNLRDALTYGANEAIHNIVYPVRRFKSRKRELPRNLSTLRENSAEIRRLKRALKGKDTDPIGFEFAGFPKDSTINYIAKAIGDTPKDIRGYMKSDIEISKLRVRRNLAGMAGDVAAVGAYGYGGYRGGKALKSRFEKKASKRAIGEGFDTARDVIAKTLQNTADGVLFPVARAKRRMRRPYKDDLTYISDRVKDSKALKKIRKLGDDDTLPAMKSRSYPRYSALSEENNTINSLAKRFGLTPSEVRKDLEGQRRYGIADASVVAGDILGDIGTVGVYGYGTYKGGKAIKDRLEKKASIKSVLEDLGMVAGTALLSPIHTAKVLGSAARDVGSKLKNKEYKKAIGKAGALVPVTGAAAVGYSPYIYAGHKGSQKVKDYLKDKKRKKGKK